MEQTRRLSNFAWTEWIVPGLVCALVIGIFAWTAAPGFHDIATLRAQDCYYNLLVQGFREGQLSVNRDVAPGLASLANPYDPTANKPYLWDIHHICHDMSYYKGKLYLYFGITPALTLFWPYVVLTKHYLADTAAVVIFFAVGLLVATGLLEAVRRRYFSETSAWITASGVMAIGLVTGTLELLSSCDVYEVAISCGFAFTMLALAGIWKSLHEPNRNVKWLLLASLAYGLAVGARPSLLFGAIILVMPAAQAWARASGPGSRRRAGLWLVPAVIPITLIGLGLMLYNDWRFGNPFEFGWHYQLTDHLQNTGTRELGWSFLWYNFRFYFIGPMHWTSHFPFLEYVPLSPQPPSYGGIEMPYSGILTDYPIAWLALAAPLALRAIPGKDISPLRWFVAAIFLLFLTSAVTVCLFLSGSSRYEFDFLPDLMLLAVIGIFGLERALAHSIAWRWPVRGIWCLLLVYSIFFNAMAGVKAHAMQNNLDGNVIFNQGDTAKAVEYFKKASELDPQSASFHFALGNALSRSGRMDESIAQYRKTLEIMPNDAEAANNLAYTLLQAGRATDAIQYFQRALQIQPSYQAYYNLGYVYGRSGNATEALACFQEAIKLQPQFMPAKIHLAWILATCPDPNVRNGNEAVALLEGVSQAGGGADAGFLRTQAAAYAEVGRFSEAITTAQKALALANARSKAGLIDELQSEIKLYQKGSPCRATIY